MMENTLKKYLTPFIFYDQILQLHIVINNVHLWDPKKVKTYGEYIYIYHFTSF
jgi:hypothetical protein